MTTPILQRTSTCITLILAATALIVVSTGIFVGGAIGSAVFDVFYAWR